MFKEENTVEQMVLDTHCDGAASNMVAEELTNYGGAYNINQGGLLHGI